MFCVSRKTENGASGHQQGEIRRIFPSSFPACYVYIYFRGIYFRGLVLESMGMFFKNPLPWIGNI